MRPENSNNRQQSPSARLRKRGRERACALDATLNPEISMPDNRPPRGSPQRYAAPYSWPRRPQSPQQQAAEDERVFQAALRNPDLRSRLISPIPPDASTSEIYAATQGLGYRAVGHDELWQYLRDPIAGVPAKGYADRFRRDIPGHNDAGDAERHTAWGAALAGRFGPCRAQDFQDAHERGAPRQPLPEEIMDLINNHNGRVLREALPRMPAETIARLALKYRLLQTRPVPFREWTP